MYAQERQQAMLAQARDAGRLDVTDMAALFEVTAETVRRDLTALERQGLLRRVHGGAIPVERLGFEPALSARDSSMTDEKERIAKAALAEVPEHGSILLDAGSTTARLADMLPVDRELTVVTNAVPIAQMLANRPAFTVLLVGGRIRGTTMAAVDSWALDALASVCVDVAFLGTNGVAPDRGLTTPDPSEAAAKRAMIAAARRTVLLTDHTKFGVVHLARFASLHELDTVVTDDGLPTADAAAVEAAGPTVVRA